LTLIPEENSSITPDYLQAEKAALQLIARAEQNTSGLSRKLEKRGHDTACIKAVIGRLAESGLLDDRRYARLWMESKVSRQTTSPRRLLAAVCAKGINLEDAEPVLKDVLDSETELRLLERYVEKLRRKQRSQRRSQRRSLGKVNHDEEEDSSSTVRQLKYILKNEGFSSLAIEQFITKEK